MFDPKGEWIEEKLRGFRLRGDIYEPIADGQCAPLQLRLQIEGKLIGFYRFDTNEKLLIPDELHQALRRNTLALEQEILARQQAEQQVEQERKRAENLAAQLRELGVNPEQVEGV